MAPPFREAEFDIMYNQGISYEGDLIDLAVDKKLVDKSGAWFSYKGERLGQGRENAKQFIREHPEIAETLDAKLREMLGPGQSRLRPLRPPNRASQPDRRRPAVAIDVSASSHSRLPMLLSYCGLLL